MQCNHFLKFESCVNIYIILVNGKKLKYLVIFECKFGL